MRKISSLTFLIAALVLCFAIFYITKSHRENKILRQIVERLSAESRIAEALVTNVKTDPQTQKVSTTIKFLEYDTKLNPLAPKYFTFSGDIIQFESLVIRFDDFYVKKGHPLKGKSAYMFMKAFAFTAEGAEIFKLNEVNEIPEGYKVEGAKSGFEKKLWEKFWQYALDPKEAKKIGIKNAQIEAPGTRFIPGLLYTIKIEHDGGMRIDATPLPKILRGEKIG